MDGDEALRRAVTRSARAPGIADLVRELGGTRQVASQLGISQRQVQRYVKADRQGRQVDSPHFRELRQRSRTDPAVRRRSVGGRRMARMRNHGARVRFKGNGGVKSPPGDDFRLRTAIAELSPEAMGRVLDAWERGDDEAALEELRNAFDSEYVGGWQFIDFDSLEFLRHTTW